MYGMKYVFGKIRKCQVAEMTLYHTHFESLIHNSKIRKNLVLKVKLYMIVQVF